MISDPDDDRAGRTPHAVDYASWAELASAISSLPDQPLGVHADSELFLAGIQDKLLLVATGGPTGWGRPVAGLPSTHILKPDPLAHPGVVLREAEALRIARRAALTTIDPRLFEIDGRPCLLINRYDRSLERAGVHRVHQEDLLQAVGLDPSARHGRSRTWNTAVRATGTPPRCCSSGLPTRTHNATRWSARWCSPY